MANTIEIYSNNIIENEINNTIAVESDAVVSCTHGFRIRTINCDGTFSDENLGSVEGSCGSNQDGSIIIHIMTEQENCDFY
ncbi:MAG: hypothetical protein LC112_09790 [Flavobacteriales bacterium]|nr:hypothetical protein [Flavobacteriales bacterium]